MEAIRTNNGNWVIMNDENDKIILCYICGNNVGWETSVTITASEQAFELCQECWPLIESEMELERRCCTTKQMLKDMESTKDEEPNRVEE
jgi:hypothetical protein